jgi:CRP/FNR family cyclic AMP-dependent transcriptional regulator
MPSRLRHPRAIIAVGLPVKSSKTAAMKSKIRPGFDVAAFLASAGPARRVVNYPVGAVVYAQGEPCEDVRYLQTGAIELSVVSRTGREAVVALLAPGDFFGEGALAGHSVRLGNATATEASTVLVIEKATMIRLLHDESAFSDRFIAFMLARSLRAEAALLDQLFNSSEKRLARALLLFARYGQSDVRRSLPKISQETLAEMIGTTRPRVSLFMNKFRKLGLIEYTRSGGLTVNDALLSIVLHD